MSFPEEVRLDEEGQEARKRLAWLLLCFSIAKLLEWRQERLQPEAVADDC